jgi:hypothetical protein
VNRNKQTRIATTTALVAWVVAAQNAGAVPVTGQYLEDPRCDPIPSQILTHEIGDILTFPLNEAIVYTVQPATFTVCVPDDGLPNDWTVTMTNASGQDWQDLFFVGDLGMRIGNSDGNFIDVVNAPGVITDAFRIDSAGINNNLLSESGPLDGIFQNGETWTFAVSNFQGPAISPPPIISTPGIFAGSDSIFPLPPTNTGSILANPVPEPGLIAPALLAAAAPPMRRLRRARARS